MILYIVTATLFPKTRLQTGSYFGFILATVTEDLLFRQMRGGVGGERSKGKSEVKKSISD